MPDAETIKIDELITKYGLEPDITDVFVEGPNDASLFKWFCHKNSRTNTSVYDISSIDVPATLVEQYGLEDNNRNRIIALAHEIERRHKINHNQVTCIADCDFNHLIGPKYTCSLLIFTDYTCMEMYMFEEEHIDKYFSIVLSGFQVSPNTLILCFTRVLSELFLVRLANEVLKSNLSLVRFQRCCTLDGDNIIFDSNEFITRYLHSNNKHALKEELLSTIEHYREKLDADPRYNIHGHDFVDLMSWYLRGKGVAQAISAPEVVERSLYGCIEVQELIKYPMFKVLLTRTK